MLINDTLVDCRHERNGSELINQAVHDVRLDSLPLHLDQVKVTRHLQHYTQQRRIRRVLTLHVIMQCLKLLEEITVLEEIFL